MSLGPTNSGAIVEVTDGLVPGLRRWTGAAFIRLPGTLFTLEDDGVHLASTDLPATYPQGFSDSRNVDMTGWTGVLRPPGDTTLNSVIRIEFSKNAANGGTQRVIYRDADGLPIERIRTATANVWNGWSTAANRGGVLALAKDGQLNSALPSAYWEGVTLRQVTAVTGGYPFDGACSTVRVLIGGVQTAMQELYGLAAADVTTSPRYAFRVAQPGVDAWGKWLEQAAGAGTGDMTKAVYDTNNNGRPDNSDSADAMAGYFNTSWAILIDRLNRFRTPNHFHAPSVFFSPLAALAFRLRQELQAFSTTFTQADGALPAVWTIGTAGYATQTVPIKVVSNKAVTALNTGADTIAYYNAGAMTDGIVQGTLTRGGGLLLRYDPVSQYGMMLLLQDGGTTLELYRIGPNTTDYFSTSTATSAASAVYRVEMVGSQYKIYENAVLLRTITDVWVGGGYVGLYVQGTAVSSVDDFSFTPTSSITGDLVQLLMDAGVLKTKNAAGTTLNVGGVQIDVYGGPASSGAFTWTKPLWASMVSVVVVSGGGGGGSGRKGAGATVRTGGGGGAGGNLSEARLPAAMLPATVAVTVQAGGVGGAAITAASTTGIAGASTTGGFSSFGTFVKVFGSQAGQGGAASAPGASVPTVNMFSGTGGGVPNTGGTASVPALNAIRAASGGGGGGSISSTDNLASASDGGGPPMNIVGTQVSGGGGVSGGIVDGAAGGAAASNASGADYGGQGGGGGAASKLAAGGGKGGKGGWPGGGAGGGGAGLDAVGNSGAGGDGANGMVLVISMP